LQSRFGGRVGNSLTRKEILAGMGATAAAASIAPRIASAETIDQIAKLIGVDPKHAGKGMSFDVGASYPVTGPAAIFGSHVTDIPKMAFTQIEQMGGPKFNIVLKDNKSGDPQAGVQGVRELGFAHVPMMLTSEVADLGAELSGIKQYKIFSLDGSGGTSLFGQGRKYFWGTIAITPNDAIPGVVKFMQKTFPAAKRLAFCGWDLGGLSDVVEEDAQKYFAGTQLVLAANERSKMGATDYSANIQKIKESNPDVVWAIVYAEDVGYFMKQYATSGINKPVFAFTHTLAAQQIAGPAYENLYFAFDYFDASRPSNPWAKFFVDEYSKNISSTIPPDYYGANSYEDSFILWQCIMRVLKKGGNPKDPDQLDAALRSNPSFPSVYGGSSTQVGTIAFDLDTHSVKSRPMMVAQFKNGKVDQLAHFDIGGADFKMLG
jgi:branched-chain amino acid transport system substrate-binding protein